MTIECVNCPEVLDTEDWTLELNEYGWIICPKCGTPNEPPEDEDSADEEGDEKFDD